MFNFPEDFLSEQTPLDGPAFYDKPDVFDIYTKHRQHRTDTPNDALEKPVIDELTGSLTGLRILDLGCGDGSYGIEALEQGCISYTGVDGSKNMAAAAKAQLANTAALVEESTIESWSYPAVTFDLVVARLSLHYINDLQTVFDQAFSSLVNGGKLVFSVEHPVITSCARGWKADTPRQDWLVDDYFVTGERVTSWLGGTIIKYHRTVEDYFKMLQQAGFTIKEIREATPVRENFKDEAQFLRRQRIPLFLIMSAEKR